MTERHRGQRWGLRGPDAVDTEDGEPYDATEDPGSHTYRNARRPGHRTPARELAPLGQYDLEYRSCPWCRLDCCAFHTVAT